MSDVFGWRGGEVPWWGWIVVVVGFARMIQRKTWQSIPEIGRFVWEVGGLVFAALGFAWSVRREVERWERGE